MIKKIILFNDGIIDSEKFFGIFQGRNIYTNWANGFKLKENIFQRIK
jgi:hypothetical protein